VLDLAGQAGIGCTIGDFSLTQLYSADELFVTGTMGGLTPVLELDGRPIGTGKPGPVTARLAVLFAELTATSGTVVC
jgi:branched-chain amino acid aminotransferase